eukprot:TRINITY_DN9622_c0_g2_i1.p1 TRINITY_DN9622_c0_g2~~TRINITY_DN9622_c0_g2_i1.p1  ORF type:complete len:167 (-),score=27.09 TRINITY_DN9622_c0_g2_i1:76-576(-)
MARFELVALVAAIALQVIYTNLYDSFFSSKALKESEQKTSDLSSRTTPTRDLVEVHEFLDSSCEGPAARVWKFMPGPPGSCTSLRPRFTLPGSEAETRDVSSQALYGRVSCASLKHEDGGHIELCSDDHCSECRIVSVMQQGECGFSFAGFAAAKWFCYSDPDVPR